MVGFTFMQVVPPMPARMVFLLLLFAPMVRIGYEYIIPIFILFFISSRFGFSVSFMPSDVWVYAIIFSLIYILFPKGRTLFSNNVVTVFFAYVIMVDLIRGEGVEENGLCLLILLILLSTTEKYTSFNNVKVLSVSFCLSSIILSLEFIIKGSQFSRLYSFSTGIERMGWNDPNYFGFAIVMGIVASLVLLLNLQSCKISEKILSFATIIISIPAIVLNSSRSTIISIGLLFVTSFLFSKIKFHYRVITVILVILFFLYLYKNHYFDLLLFRVENVSFDGGREFIWQTKVNTFFQQSNIADLLFGYGYKNGYNIGFSHGQGFHNEFLATLVDYGFVGLSLFIYIVFSPILMIRKKRLVAIMPLILLLMACFTLEPWTMGSLSFYLFYFYFVAITKNKRYT